MQLVSVFCRHLSSGLGAGTRDASMLKQHISVQGLARACEPGYLNQTSELRNAVQGSYNWNFVYGIEQIVEWCRAHGVKVMFTFLDNWSPVDSKTAVRHSTPSLALSMPRYAQPGAICIASAVCVLKHVLFSAAQVILCSKALRAAPLRCQVSAR